MKIVGIDTETERIGPGQVVPDLICCSIYDGKSAPELYSHVEEALEARLLELLTDPDVLIVGHNFGGFDVPVLMKAFPRLAPLWWQALEDERVSCTMLREMLLNLSISGTLSEVEMPDGSVKNIKYGLGDLVLHYFQIDLEEAKHGEESWRTNFGILKGLKASQYPKDAADYAKMDAVYAFDLYGAQQDRVQTENGYASLSTDRFQTAVSTPLTWITERGMATDPAAFEQLQAMLAVELSDEKLGPLYNAGILRPPVPPLPYVKQEPKARKMLASWLGVADDDVDWARADEGTVTALMDAGIQFKQPEEATKDVKRLKQYILGAQLARQMDTTIEAVLGKDLETLMRTARDAGLRWKRTKTGEVCTDKTVIEDLAPFDPTIKVFQHREKLQKLVTTELPRMMWEGKLSPVVHFPFKTIVETSRTSSSASDYYPSANGQNVDPRARVVFVPRPGFVLCSTDYSMLELVCVGQTTYDLFGYSIHRDKINEGYDLHAYLGSQLALNLDPVFQGWLGDAGVRYSDSAAVYKFFKSLKSTNYKYYKLWRTFAKPIGLGLPGGLGPWKLIETAIKEPYFVDIVKVAVERFEQFPEEFEVTRILLFHAKRMHRMTEETFRWTPQMKGIALAIRLKEIWLDTYPEMKDYFEWVKNQHDENNPVLMTTEDEETGEIREVKGLCYTTPMGMFRAGATFTKCANGRAMQSVAAEGFKCAIFNVVRATMDPTQKSPLYGNVFVVDEIHDEILTEIRIEVAHEMAMLLKKLMEDSMGAVIRNVKVTASPCLMDRWYKVAEPVYDRITQKLVLWKPGTKYEEIDDKLYVKEAA